jgi:hypothetical protein
VDLVVDLHTTALAVGVHVVPQELEPPVKAIMVGSVHITHTVQVVVAVERVAPGTTPLGITSAVMVELVQRHHLLIHFQQQRASDNSLAVVSI